MPYEQLNQTETQSKCERVTQNTSLNLSQNQNNIERTNLSEKIAKQQLSRAINQNFKSPDRVSPWQTDLNNGEKNIYKDIVINSETTKRNLAIRTGISFVDGKKKNFIQLFYPKNDKPFDVYRAETAKNIPKILSELKTEMSIRDQIFKQYNLLIYPSDPNLNQKYLVFGDPNFPVETHNSLTLKRVDTMRTTRQKLQQFPPNAAGFKKFRKDGLVILTYADQNKHRGGNYNPALNATLSTPEVIFHEVFHKIDYEVDENLWNLYPSELDRFWIQTMGNSEDYIGYAQFLVHLNRQPTPEAAEAFEREYYRKVNPIEEKSTFIEWLFNDHTQAEFKNGQFEKTDLHQLLQSAAGQKNPDGSFTVDKTSLKNQYGIEMMTGQPFEDFYERSYSEPYRLKNKDDKKDVLTTMKTKKLVPYLQQIDPRMSTAQYWQYYLKNNGIDEKYWEQVI